jgi:dihydroorotate dehydrogenase
VSFYERLIRPVLFNFPAEGAHHLALWGIKNGLVPQARGSFDPVLRTRAFGLEFLSPIGLAAGFDKNAEVAGKMAGLGFGFTEAGTVTPLAQPGNPKPRIFRLAEDHAVINRLGFNNKGLDEFTKNFSRAKSSNPVGIIGANVGKNKDSTDAVADYVTGVSKLSEIADYLVVNVSSPNTPGLRDLQSRENLEVLLTAVMAARASAPKQPPLLLKFAPDMDDAGLEEVAEAAIAHKIDGLIATNTTVDRPEGLVSRFRAESGGLSGRPLMAPSTDSLLRMYRLTEGRLPLIGVGGVFTGEDVYRKIRAGASLVQVYSAMIYRGPHLAMRLAKELSDLLKRDGFSSVSAAIGADVK